MPLEGLDKGFPFAVPESDDPVETSRRIQCSVTAESRAINLAAVVSRVQVSAQKRLFFCLDIPLYYRRIFSRR